MPLVTGDLLYTIVRVGTYVRWTVVGATGMIGENEGYSEEDWARGLS